MFYGKSPPFARWQIGAWGGEGKDQGEIVSQPNRQKTGLELRYIRRRREKDFFADFFVHVPGFQRLQEEEKKIACACVREWKREILNKEEEYSLDVGNGVGREGKKREVPSDGLGKGEGKEVSQKSINGFFSIRH